MNQYEIFRSSLDGHLKAKGWSKTRLGEETGIEPTTISKWERLKHVPGLRTLEKLAKAFGCAPSDLIDPSDNLFRESKVSRNLEDELFASDNEPQVGSTFITEDLNTGIVMNKGTVSLRQKRTIQAAKEIYARLLAIRDASPKIRGQLKQEIVTRVEEFEKICDLEKDRQ